jgi:2-polyprenyl-6-methoxyphenol hydroxylase-like FAD-dependent oxidoreductase
MGSQTGYNAHWRCGSSVSVYVQNAYETHTDGTLTCRMTPFAGVGVNVAMEDALSLATQIKQWKQSGASSSIIEPIRAYEEEMFARAEGYAKETMMYLDLFFHERGGIAMCEQFAKAKAEEKAVKAAMVAEVKELSLTAAAIET